MTVHLSSIQSSLIRFACDLFFKTCLTHFLHLILLFSLPWSTFFKITYRPPRPISFQKAFYLNFPAFLVASTLHLAYIELWQLSSDAITFVICVFWSVYIISLNSSVIFLPTEALPSPSLCVPAFPLVKCDTHTADIHSMYVYWLNKGRVILDLNESLWLFCIAQTQTEDWSSCFIYFQVCVQFREKS